MKGVRAIAVLLALGVGGMLTACGSSHRASIEPIKLPQLAPGEAFILAAQPGRAAAARHCPTPAGQAVSAGELIPALRKLVPQRYGNMTNQQGRGAWRGYIVVCEFDIGWPRYAGLTYPPAYRRSAVRACGTRVADMSWVVIIQFPRSQAADLSTSAAYIVRTVRGLTIWRDQVVKPQGWK